MNKCQQPGCYRRVWKEGEKLCIRHDIQEVLQRHAPASESQRHRFTRNELQPADRRVTVKNGFESHFAAGFFLYPFHLRPLNFPDGSAFDAYDVVVMRSVKLYLITRFAIGSVDAVDQLAFLQHLNRAKDGHFADSVSFEGMINFIHAEVVMCV